MLLGNRDSEQVLEAIENPDGTYVPPKAITLVIAHQEMANHLEKCPQDRAWAEQLVERNLFRPLARCQQLPTEICARFPNCLCGVEALENSMKDLRNRKLGAYSEIAQP